MRVLVLLVSLFILGYAHGFGFMPTALDVYVHSPDSSYTWSLNSSFREASATVYVISLTSQTYTAPYFSTNSPVWTHWMTVCVPDVITRSKAHHGVLYVDGGNNGDPVPTTQHPVPKGLCSHTGLITTHLMQVPNQPIVFNNDGIDRYEDGILAYGWAKYMNNTQQSRWIVRLAMVKAAKRALDTVQDFVDSLPNLRRITGFTVAGASKRGWVAWLLGAVDLRVRAMIPMVMPILNIVPNMNHHYQAYGEWSFTLGDYLANGVMHKLNDPVFLKLAALEDPWSYRYRLWMPKLVIASCGDEFFLPDSAQFFVHGLIGEWYLEVVPNAGHSLGTFGDNPAAFNKVITTMGTFINLIADNQRRPAYEYELTKSNTTASIELWLAEPPFNVTLWKATTLSTTKRDFRQYTPVPNPVLWTSELLAETSEGYYVASVSKPEAGWTGFLIEVVYQYDNGYENFVFSTEVNIVPDALPFPPCGNNC